MTLFWFQNNLRLTANSTLNNALDDTSSPVIPLYIFNSDYFTYAQINEPQIPFVYNTLVELKSQLQAYNSDLYISYIPVQETFAELQHTYQVKHIYTDINHPILKLLQQQGIQIHIINDHVYFPENTIVKKDASPYCIYTPYMKQWKLLFQLQANLTTSSKPNFNNLHAFKSDTLVLLKHTNCNYITKPYPSATINDTLIKNYHLTRDTPSIEGTSKLGVHLRFGTISIKELVEKSAELNDIFLNELIWREFYHMIFHFYPNTAFQSFKKQYDSIEWLNNEDTFFNWCNGETGYPLVDAGMRELNETGFMHNRVRMIAASFLTKHLLIDWRWGEAYFASRLVDYDIASNVGGWQWAASCGCDAVPYFRIFNPIIQQQKFDSKFIYIKKWIPEIDTHYFYPIIEHAFARDRAIKTYKNALIKK